jgi:DNA replication and repair protein RecF
VDEEISAGLLARLHKTRADEIARGLTMIGPHRDELRFVASGVDLGIYGSRGQARSAVLALKLAEMAWMRDRSGEWPVLLMDEVLSELDPYRRHEFLSHINGADQSLLTTADLNMFEGGFREEAEVWVVKEGSVLPYSDCSESRLSELSSTT